MITIKEESEKTGVSSDTIRYYERIGLIPPVSRNKNGIRKFDEEDLRWIIFSRHMRSAGLTIEMLTEYISLFHQGDKTVNARVELLKEQRRELKKRIDSMQKVLDRLDYKIENYTNHVLPSQNKLKEFDQTKKPSKIYHRWLFLQLEECLVSRNL